MQVFRNWNLERLNMFTMCNNKMTCLAIDNWSEFGGPKNTFLENFNKFKGENNVLLLKNLG